MITKLIGVAAMTILVAMPAVAGPTDSNYYQTVGYYLADGTYVRTLYCWRHFVGYDVYGYAVYRRVCGYR